MNLAESQSVKRSRPEEEDGDRSPSEDQKAESIWKAILFPDAQDELGDMMDRVLPAVTNSEFKVPDLSGQIQYGSKRRRVIVLSAEQESRINQLLDKRVKDEPVAVKKSIKKTPKAPAPIAADRGFVEVLTPSVLEPANELKVQLVAPYKMFPYQIQAVQWVSDREQGRLKHQYWTSENQGAVLAMTMGLGKTLVMIGLILQTLPDQRRLRTPTLYVCPKNLLGTVRNEFLKFAGDQIKVLIYHKDFLGSLFETLTEEKLRNFDVVIVNYEAVVYQMYPRKVDPLKPPLWPRFQWYRIILDESHEIRSQHTKRFNAFAQLRGPRRICMSGTPIHNSLRDLVSQLIFTGCQLPTSGKGKTHWTKDTLKRMRLLDQVLFIEHAAANVKLPEKLIERVNFNLSEEETALHRHYLHWTKHIYNELYKSNDRQERTKTLGEAQQSLVRVMQICSAPYLITPAAKKDASAEDMAVVDAVQVFPSNLVVDAWIKNREGPAGIGSSKMKVFVQLMDFFKKTHPEVKIVVFANFSSTLRLAEQAMRCHDAEFDQQHVTVTGQVTSSKKRENLYASFRQNPKVRSLFMTLKLGNQGMNLTEARVVVMLEMWFSYSAHHQGECRVHRIGQENFVQVYYLIPNNSIEERMYRVAMEKKKLAEDLTYERECRLSTQHISTLLEDEEESSPPAAASAS